MANENEIRVVNKEKLDDGLYRYDLLYKGDAPTGSKVMITTASGDTALITCQPGSTAHKAGYTDLLELSVDGTWTPIE